MVVAHVFIVVVLAALGVAVGTRITRDVLPSGKCNPYHIEPKPVDYDKLARLGRLNILYVPDAEPFRQLDHAYVEVTPNNDDSYRVVVTKVTKAKSKSLQEFRHRYIGNIIAEVSRYGTGNYTHHHNYPLAVSEGNAILIYRCSEIGRVEVDTRYIIVPAGNEVSEAGRQELFNADKKYNFRGGLYKLPYAHA